MGRGSCQRRRPGDTLVIGHIGRCCIETHRQGKEQGMGQRQNPHRTLGRGLSSERKLDTGKRAKLTNIQFSVMLVMDEGNHMQNRTRLILHIVGIRIFAVIIIQDFNECTTHYYCISFRFN